MTGLKPGALRRFLVNFRERTRSGSMFRITGPPLTKQKGTSVSIHNADIARTLDAMADLLEIEGANPFRVRAYRNASRVVETQSREIRTLIDENFDLTSLPGIGPDLAGKIREIARSGTLAELQKRETETPPSLLELLKIPGLGPARVRALHSELGIKTVDELRAAARSGRIERLKGFGKKSALRILDSLREFHGEPSRFRIDVADQYARPLLSFLEKAPGVLQASIAGSLRRRKETVGDLDMVVSARPGSPVMDRFLHYEEVREVVSHGETRSTVLLNSGLQVDLRVVSGESFGSALYYFTGSKSHNIAVRRLGQALGLKINEYGVFRGKERIGGKTEDSVFNAVRLATIPPELRENQGEIEAAQSGTLPSLIERKDLRGDLHSHTSLTDGQNTLQEMTRAALARGFEYLGVTEHSRRLGMAHGLDSERTLKNVEAIRELDEQLKGLALLAGMEVDILPDGSLDLPDSVLSRLDLVIGAVHSDFTLSREKQTSRILRAMDNPFLTILAHPGGRHIGERPPMEIDWTRLIRHAKDRRTILEINGQPSRLDLTEVYARMAKEEGVLMAINSDSHSTDQFDNLDYGIGQARRGWITKENIVNTRPLAELKRIFGGIRLI